MNLILVASLILAWSTFRESPDIAGLVVDVHDRLTGESAQRPDDLVAAFLDKWDAQASADPRERALSLPIGDVLALREANLTRVFRGGIRSEREAHEYERRRMRAEQMDDDPEASNRASRAMLDHVRSIGMPLEARLVYRKIDALERMYAGSGMRENDTLGQLEQRLALKVRVPVLEQAVPARLAVTLLSLALIGPFLYLVSICAAIRERAASSTAGEGADWIFFHPGALGPAIGAAWLMAPAAIVLGAWAGGYLREWAGLPLGLSLLALSGWTLAAAYRARTAFRNAPRAVH